MAPRPLPSFNPELNAAEPIFRALRPKPSTRIFATVAELEEELTRHHRPCWDEPALLQRLTGFPWWAAGLATMPRSP